MAGSAATELGAGAAILTASTSRARSGGSDESGDALAVLAESIGFQVVGRDLVVDDRDQIEVCLRRWVAESSCDLILTTGGTGFSPDDVTPEATAAVLERPAPGIAEAMRAASKPFTDHWMLSRALAGISGSTLIVNFPGSPKAIAQTAGAIAVALPHAVALLRGGRGGHAK